MSTAIEVAATAVAITQDQLKLARETVAKGLNDTEFGLFCYNCSRQGVHPLDGLLIPLKRQIKDEWKLTFTTTVDLLRSRAADSGEYAGSEDPTFEYPDVAGGKPDSATVTVWRLVQNQRCAFTATARWTEYYPGQKQGFMWDSKPHVMLGKCAEALALRKAFPKQLAGLYAPEELDRLDDTPPEPEPIRHAEKKAAAPKQQAPSPEAKPEPAQGEVVDEQGGQEDSDFITVKQLNRLIAIQAAAKVSDDDVKTWMERKYKIKSRKKIPRSAPYTHGIYEDTIDFIDPEFKFHPKPEAKEEEEKF